MSSDRRSALAAGVLYLVTHVTSVAAVPLYAPVLGDPAGAGGGDAGARLGALLEVVLALGVMGTAVLLYPHIRRWGEGMALGHVAGRVLEGAVILMGVASVLGIVTLRQGPIPAPEGAAQTLVALHDWSFWLGPNAVLVASTALLAVLLVRSRLVPRWIPVLGLVGCATLLGSSIGILFGVIDQVSVWGAIGAAPMFAWEISLAVRLIGWGFAPAAAPLETGREQPVALR